MARLTAEQWKAAEDDYRAGMGSLDAIGERYGISKVAVHKHMKAAGIRPDLKAAVARETERRLIAPKVNAVNAQVNAATRERTDEQIVEDAAQERETVVRTHRQDISRAANTVRMLAEQLAATATHRELVEGIIIANTDPRARSAIASMEAAISIPKHAATVRDLTTAMKNLVALERQAYNLGVESEEEGIEGWLDKLAERDAKAAAAKGKTA